MNTYKSNVAKIYGFSFFNTFLVLVPIIVPYFMQLGLSMSEVFFIQAMFGFSMACFEVPSAYLGDIWGRKRILVLGSIIYAIGFTLLLWAKDFYSLLFYEVFLAIGISFISGADLSIMYDSIGDDRMAKIKAIGNFHALQLVGESTAALACAFLMLYGYDYVIYLQVLVAWIPVLFVLSIKEPAIERMSKDSHKENLKEVIHYMFIENPLLRLTFVNMVLWSVSTFCAVWIIQKYWVDQSVELHQIGLLWAACNLTAAVIAKFSHRIESLIGTKMILILMSLLPIVTYLVMGLFPGLIGVALTGSFYISRGINMAIMKERFNHEIPDKFRNTANSLNSLFFRMSFFVLGPIIGMLIDKRGLDEALVILGLFFFVCFVILMIPLVRRIGSE